uniref:Glucosylceramidase n=1 Tax=Malurus cyaneus samueli TaxID=2593467 RepID=A0A8C5TQ53_9PASS
GSAQVKNTKRGSPRSWAIPSAHTPAPVCNATYCDTLDPLVLPAVGSYVKYESSKAGKRLERSEGRGVPAGLLLTLNISAMYQRVKGFGGSLSDAAAMNILKLSRPAQDNLLRSYSHRIEYNLVRVPMACSDFSVPRVLSRAGSCGFGVLQLELTLSLRPLPQIPLLRRALAMSKRPLCLFASPWTAPGTLKGKAGDKYHKTWANYFIKYRLWSQAGQSSQACTACPWHTVWRLGRCGWTHWSWGAGEGSNLSLTALVGTESPSALFPCPGAMGKRRLRQLGVPCSAHCPPCRLPSLCPLPNRQLAAYQVCSSPVWPSSPHVWHAPGVHSPR